MSMRDKIKTKIVKNSYTNIISRINIACF